MPKSQDLFDRITSALNNWKTEVLSNSKDGAATPSDEDVRSDVSEATEAFLEQIGLNPETETGTDNEKAA